MNRRSFLKTMLVAATTAVGVAMGMHRPSRTQFIKDEYQKSVDRVLQDVQFFVDGEKVDTYEPTFKGVKIEYEYSLSRPVTFVRIEGKS